MCFAVTGKLISTFVSATRIVQSIYFLNTKYQASSHLLWLYSPVYVGPGQKPRRPVFSRGSYLFLWKIPYLECKLRYHPGQILSVCYTIAVYQLNLPIQRVNLNQATTETNKKLFSLFVQTIYIDQSIKIFLFVCLI